MKTKINIDCYKLAAAVAGALESNRKVTFSVKGNSKFRDNENLTVQSIRFIQWAASPPAAEPICSFFLQFEDYLSIDIDDRRDFSDLTFDGITARFTLTNGGEAVVQVPADGAP